MKNYINEVNVACVQLINCKDDFFYMKQGVDNLYNVFKTTSGIDINDLNNGEIMLPSGKAISPSAAAYCLLEMKRTAVFLRGIKKAIDKKLKNKDGIVNILYAGCGPYATLITPLLTMYNTNEIKITLLDINQTSLLAAEKLLKGLGLAHFIDEYILADASNYITNKEYDIVISETMQACLQNEPQVSIMQNLIPQMKEDAIFIPQKIYIDAFLRNPGTWNETVGMWVGIKSKFLKDVFYVDKTNLDSSKYKQIVNIPDNLKGFIELVLHTTIVVYEDEMLGVNNCSLNMPIKFYEFRKSYAKSIAFWYSLLPQPKVECKVLEFS